MFMNWLTKQQIKWKTRDLGEKHEKKRGLAMALALLLGGFGAHWFYLGRIKKGVVYFLFSWTFIPELLAIISLIKWAMMHPQEWRRRFAM